MLSTTVGDILDPLRRPGRRKPAAAAVIAPAIPNISEQLLSFAAVAILILLFGKKFPTEAILLMGGTLASAIAEMRGIRVGSSSPRAAGLPLAFMLIPALCLAKISLFPTLPHVTSAATIDSAYWRFMLDLSLACGLIAVGSCFFKEAPLYGGAWFASLANITMWALFMRMRLRPEIDTFLVAAPLCIFYATMTCLSHRLARSFSVGESLIIAQAVALYSAEIISTLAGMYWPSEYLAFYLHRIVRPSSDRFLQCLFVATCVASALLILGRRSKGLSYIIAALFAFPVTLLIWSRFVDLPILWLWYSHLSQASQLYLSLYWAVLLLLTLAVLALLHYTAPSLRFDFGARKLFHLLALLLFAPGVWFSASYLRIAQAGAFAVLFLLELALGSRPFANSPIRRFFLHFRDDQDDPELLLTHLYLLAGCALPLWLEPQPDPSLLRIYAGLLVLGVADTAASLVGRAFGRIRWPSRRRTIEGSIAAIVASLAVVYLVVWSTTSEWESLDWKRLALVCGAIALLEALGSHIDNITLPPVFYTALVVFLPSLRFSNDMDWNV